MQRISFARNQQDFLPIRVNGIELRVVERAKLLGLTLSSNLTWNPHIDNVIKKSAKWINLRSYTTEKGKTTSKGSGSLLHYMHPIYFGLCNYSVLLCLANVFTQRTRTPLKSPSLTQYDALSEANIPTIISYGKTTGKNFLSSIVNNQDNKGRTGFLLSTIGVPSLSEILLFRLLPLKMVDLEYRIQNIILPRALNQNMVI